jgi:Uroporphyrinogen-III decarboxylase
MNSRERVIKALKHEEVDRLPRDLWTLPGIKMYRMPEFEELIKKYPMDFTNPVYKYGTGIRCTGNPSEIGTYTDAWGCTWQVGEPGIIGEVKDFPIKSLDDIYKYELPWELLDKADLTMVKKSCMETDKFVIVGTETRPFERMQFLRGTENLFMDLAYQEKEIYQLRDKLHEFFKREMKMWADTEVDAVAFMDDWGTQKTLLISPDIWRKFYKPLYKDYCDILHSKGKYAFFHSDGNIELIYPDLVEIGVDAVNSQLFCMDIEGLGRRYSGKITFWGEIDRQNILPFGTTEEVKSAVKRAARALLNSNRTGVIAQCEWGLKDPKGNIETVFDEWSKY